MAQNTHIKLYLPFPMTKSPGRMNIYMYFPWLNELYFWTVFRNLLWFLKVVSKKIATTHIIGACEREFFSDALLTTELYIMFIKWFWGRHKNPLRVIYKKVGKMELVIS
jgi:hypothetical protein